MWIKFNSGEQVRRRHQVVYVMQFDGATKIGLAASPTARASTLSGASGREFLHGYFFDAELNARGLEMDMHARFAQHRRVGEWFGLLADDVVAGFHPVASDYPRKIRPEIDEARAREFFDRLFPLPEQGFRMSPSQIVDIISAPLAMVTAHAAFNSAGFDVREAHRAMLSDFEEYPHEMEDLLGDLLPAVRVFVEQFVSAVYAASPGPSQVACGS
ncbi:GIY-YIG nuclease family protein [Albimonas pacifica]|uniref:Meiotically up-regulated gene 113 n=1 Tax=Albimonas pacifica TaxID=1114924 RepID=A0A1I3LIU6_9RHOB|nr:hypothetical protein SAMN05216258_11050 [Albimonas pacifica]